ncbi:hypothetical protein C8N24_0679 [Solirubrobacter pauli]|uniref:Uncharacterized protein n=1 Tax=Solirubrobacter pauli TaxID=166793 RepID=A0A660LCU0_9ACTN|nr:hypothetical protein [Solirubrobacter pauli]RKQ90864.1 hypothetical protein C8N24_0679 [Solirubrobacter pauli]
MHENAVTEALVNALQASGDAVAARFLLEVFGVEVKRGSPLRYRLQAGWEPLGHTQAIVAGLAPLPGLADADTKTTPGSIVDAVIAGDVAVLIEVKVRGRCERAQLVRHARHWALSVPGEGWSTGTGPGLALTTWARVGGWLARELDRESAATLVALAAVLEGEGLVELNPAVPAADPVEAVPVEAPPTPTAFAAMTAGVDLARLRRRCVALYGPGGPEHVAADGCKADTERVIAAFEAAGMHVPPGLREVQRGGVMTPRRVLSALFGDEGLRAAKPKHWTDLRDRVLGRGGDRAVLLAILAWAAARRDAEADLVSSNVALVWARAPERGPAVPELHTAIDESRNDDRTADTEPRGSVQA